MPARNSSFTSKTPPGQREVCQSLRLMAFFLLGLLGTQPLGACPAFLQLGPDLGPIAGKKKQLYLFRYQPQADGKPSWQQLPLQVDSRNKAGALLFSANYRESEGYELTPNDRLVFRPEHFGRARPPGQAFPCPSSQAYRLVDGKAAEKIAYLLACRQPPHNSQLASPEPSVSYQAEKHLLTSPQFSYEFNKLNHLLFDHISFAQGEGGHEAVALNSKMMIFSDIKHMFNLHFDDDDIQSQIEKIQIGPLGINASVSFYLKILFLKLKLSLVSEVSFYEDSAYIPMVVHLPVKASSYLRPHSGIIYHWLLASSYQQKKKHINMPQLTKKQAQVIKELNNPLQKQALANCQKDGFCNYRYEVSGEKELVMEFNLSRSLVENSFFPYYSEDLPELSQVLGWGLNLQKEPQRVGLFFATAGLGQGSHGWDFWLHLGRKQKNASLCPRPVLVHREEVVRK